MNSKPQKQSEPILNEKQRKNKKHKNPYNINISFNINNPKKVISNQINKTIKVNHYSFTPQDQLSKLNKINFSKILAPSSKSHSSSLSKSKDLFKQEYLKDLSKYECYLENQIPPKKHKKSKSKPYDIETKSKSDFTYTASILSMPFPGNDPLPDAAIKTLNKMKKYFLQKIGSMDITAPEDTVEPTSDLIHQSKNLKTSQLKLHEQKNERKEYTQKIFPDNDEIMTEKLSEYQYENLISYENQNDQKQNDSISKSKELFDYQPNDSFPQIVLDNLNSMTIKNQYLRHHSKFISQNKDLFKKQSQQKNNKKSNKISFDQLSAQIKSKIINPFDQTYRKAEKKHKKEKSKLLIQSHQSESKAMKQKIKIIQQILLKSDSSKSILKIGQKSGKSLINKLETSTRVEDFYKKDLKKQYVIKTQIQLPNDLVNQIKQFESQNLSENKVNEDKQSLDHQKNNTQKQLVDKISYVQFLSLRDEQVDRKETRELIQGYIDLLQEHLHIHDHIRKPSNQESLKEAPSATQIRYQPSQKSDSYKIYPEQSQSRTDEDQQLSQSQEQTSEVSSYIYGDNQQNQPDAQIDYSPERNHKIQLQKQMRQELAKRLTHQFNQKQQLNDEGPLKIILNSNLQEHSVKQNNSDLEYRRKTQDISEVQKQTHSYQPNIHQNTQIRTESVHQNLSYQMDTLLGFVKRNINFHSADKKVLKDLYEKLIKLSKPQINPPFQAFAQNHQQQQKDSQNHKQVINSYPIESVQTPKKQEKMIKKPIFHKRSYSTQKDTTKLPKNIAESDDINLWDLILVEERLNKKYNEITYEKQKQLFEIQTNPALTYDQYQQKIDELEKWQNQAKRQILQTKKEIKTGIINLRKILTPQSSGISFKMKSFSEKHLMQRFNFDDQSSNTSQKQSQKHTPYQNDKEINLKNQNRRDNLIPQKIELNQNSKAQEQAGKHYPKVSVNLDSIFINQQDNSTEREQNLPKKIKQIRQLNKVSQLRQSKQKEPLKFSEKQTENPCYVPRIQLLRTGSSRYKNLLENHQTESIGSSKSSNSSQIYQNENIYQQNADEKQDFIDLLKIQKYRLGNLHEFCDQFESQSIEDTIQKLPESYSQTTIEPSKASIQNFKITQQDKLDICQFILLDLCIEMYQETLDLEDSSIIKGGYSNSTMQHRIMKDIFAFIKKEKKKPKKKGPKIGIHTELQTVKDYIEKIQQYVQSLSDISLTLNHQSAENNLIITRINAPIGPTAVEILKTMRFYQDEVFQSREQAISPQFSQNQGLNSLILPVYVFTDFEERLQAEKEFVFDTYFEDAEKQKNRLAFLKNVTHVHHKALFDALNQMLDFQRPWGIWGKPFPWKTRNNNMKQQTQENLQSSLKKSCDKVIQCAMYMCGLLIDKEQSLVKNTTVSEAYIEEVKEDRMSKMIINDFIQNENRFYFLDDEQTQIMLETSYVVWLLLIQEAVRQINTVRKINR